MSASPQTGYADALAAPDELPNANAPCARRLSLLPFAQGGEHWAELVKRARGSSVYHGPQWRRILESAYGLSFRLALLEEEGVPAAGCILARSYLNARHLGANQPGNEE